MNKSDNNIKKFKKNNIVNEQDNNNNIQNIYSENENETQKKENKNEDESSNILFRVKSVRIPSKCLEKLIQC